MARHCLLAHTRGITLNALPVKTPRLIYGGGGYGWWEEVWVRLWWIIDEFIIKHRC